MKEVEVKVLEVDKDEIVKKLLEYGAQKTYEGPVVNILFDKGKELQEKHQTLRLRKMGEKYIITFKQKLSKEATKISEEIETEIADYDKAEAILKGLGFAPTYFPEKQRESYKLEDMTFDFDTYEMIPTILEIESESEDKVLEWCKKLELDMDKVKSWNTRDLFDHYNIKVEHDIVD